MWAGWLFPRSESVRGSEPHDDEIRPCGDCQLCVRACPTSALRYAERVWRVDLTLCIFCQSCARVCPNNLISPLDRN